MTITRRTPATTVPATAASFTVTKPTGVAASDRVFLYVGGKYGGGATDPPTVATTGGSSWSLIMSAQGGGPGGTGADIGLTVGFIYAKDLTATDVSNAWTVTPAAAAFNSWEAIAVAYATTVGWLDVIDLNYPGMRWTDANTGTTLTSEALDTALPNTVFPKTGDIFLCFGTIPTDAATSISSSVATWAGTNLSNTAATSTTYVENALNADTCSVAGYWDTITGTATDANPSVVTFTFNISVNSYGHLQGIIVREGTAAVPRNTHAFNPAIARSYSW